MKTSLLFASALGVGLLAGSAALAQTPPPAPPPAGSPQPKDDTRMPPEPQMNGEESAGGDMNDGPPDMAPMRDRHGMGHHWRRGARFGGPPHMMMPPPSKAAYFRIKNGPFRFEVKCADDEPMQACADIASKLLGEAKGLPMR